MSGQETEHPDRPMPGPGEHADPGSDGHSSDIEIVDPKDAGEVKIGLDREDETQDFVDQSKIDFDPDEGLYSGTAVDGSTEIPGPHDTEGDEQSIIEEAKEMAGDDPPDSEATTGVVAKSRAAQEDADSSGDDEPPAG